jgi:hypothetical protein
MSHVAVEPVFVLKQLSTSARSSTTAFSCSAMFLTEDERSRSFRSYGKKWELEDAPLTWTEPIRVVAKVLQTFPSMKS